MRFRWSSVALLATLAACSGGDDGDAGKGDSGRSDAGQRDAALPFIDRERSLVWIDPAIVDDPATIGLGRVMAAVSDDEHGGRMLAEWFETFATTSHSERLGPALLVGELRDELGDPSTWDLDALPFQVTGVHNRIDLGPRGGGCGELRVSFASTHPIYAPFHLIFLFRQEPGEGDVSGTTTHCQATAASWARLTELGHDEFVAAARAKLDETITKSRFLMAESVELTVSPWEWRQWKGLVENPPLFQTVDVERLNQPGPLRDDFLAFARDNAESLMAREVEIPSRFRPQSARVAPGVERPRLDLTLEGYPGIAEAIEAVGCPACHTEHADFVQTTPQRTFSDFYDHELDARAEWLARLSAGEPVPAPPYGPLQAL